MELNGKDCALIFKENNEIELIIPTYEDDENVDMNVQVAATLCIMLTNQDKELNDLINKNYAIYIDEINDIEGNTIDDNIPPNQIN